MARNKFDSDWRRTIQTPDHGRRERFMRRFAVICSFQRHCEHFLWHIRCTALIMGYVFYMRDAVSLYWYLNIWKSPFAKLVAVRKRKCFSASCDDKMEKKYHVHIMLKKGVAADLDLEYQSWSPPLPTKLIDYGYPVGVLSQKWCISLGSYCVSVDHWRFEHRQIVHSVRVLTSFVSCPARVHQYNFNNCTLEQVCRLYLSTCDGSHHF